MHLPRTIIGLVTAMLIAFAALPAAAQDASPDAGLEDISQLEGIVSAVSRSWAVDSNATPTASPVAGAAADQPDPGGAIFMIGTVIEFETDANAGRAFDLYRDYSIGQETTFDEEDDVVANAPIGGLGDNAHGFDIGSSAEDADFFFRDVMVQDGSYFFLVIIAAASADATIGADQMATYLVSDGEPSPDEAAFSADGTSTGGNWGFFPATGHESLDGLVLSMDELLYPVPDENA